MQTTKSATTAGLLGVFLGSFGAHSWYLGKKILGIIHIALFVVGLFLLFLATSISLVSDYSYTYNLTGPPAIVVALSIIGTLFILGNAIWGFVEGIVILVRGDAALKNTVSAAPNKPTPTPKPHDPKTFKKVAIGISIGFGALVLLLVACVICVFAFRVDYGETYRAARDLKPHITKIANNSACEDVIDYANSPWLSEKAYDKYIETCKKSADRDDDLVRRLETSSAIRRDDELSVQFDKFKSAYDAAVPDRADLTKKLDLYQAWHKYISLSDDLTTKSSEDDFRDAAKPLEDSGNDTLKSYAAGWLERALAYRQAYNTYWDGKHDNSAREAMDKAEDALEDWIDDNEINMEEIAELDPADMDDFRTEFSNLYDMIVETYEENYNYDSGDCTELFDSVYCD